MPRQRVTAYVLAGGQSSRMGEDKAALRFGGQTLAEIAAQKLRLCCDEVVVVSGQRDLALTSDRTIRDLHPGCGPIGGMEAALADLREGGGSDWAMFVPVDMPLVPAGLLNSLIELWLRDTRDTRVSLAKAAERVQPLLSLLHLEVEPYLARAVAAGRYKVTPILREAAEDLARARGLTADHTLRVDTVDGSDPAAVLDWTPSDEERRTERLWFQNVNTPAEFREMEQMFAGRGEP